MKIDDSKQLFVGSLSTKHCCLHRFSSCWYTKDAICWYCLINVLLIVVWLILKFLNLLFLIVIHSIKDWIATARHRVTRKRGATRLNLTAAILVPLLLTYYTIRSVIRKMFIHYFLLIKYAMKYWGKGVSTKH